jgi:hypothetical protein
MHAVTAKELGVLRRQPVALHAVRVDERLTFPAVDAVLTRYDFAATEVARSFRVAASE